MDFASRLPVILSATKDLATRLPVIQVTAKDLATKLPDIQDTTKDLATTLPVILSVAKDLRPLFCTFQMLFLLFSQNPDHLTKTGFPATDADDGKCLFE